MRSLEDMLRPCGSPRADSGSSLDGRTAHRARYHSAPEVERRLRHSLWQWLAGALIQGVDYGPPDPDRYGCHKSVLYGTGADALAAYLDLRPEYILRCRRPMTVDADRGWCFVPLFRHSGVVLSIGCGSWSLSAQPPVAGGCEKRAMESALVDAVLRLPGFRLADLFTADADPDAPWVDPLLPRNPGDVLTVPEAEFIESLFIPARGEAEAAHMAKAFVSACDAGKCTDVPMVRLPDVAAFEPVQYQGD